MLDRIRALILLQECTGRDIWPTDWCRQQGVPETWIEELADTYESGFGDDRETIYHANRITNQFHGVWDRHLAYRLGEFLGVDTHRVAALTLPGEAEVRAIREAVEEG